MFEKTDRRENNIHIKKLGLQNEREEQEQTNKIKQDKQI